MLAILQNTIMHFFPNCKNRCSVYAHDTYNSLQRGFQSFSWFFIYMNEKRHCIGANTQITAKMN